MTPQTTTTATPAATLSEQELFAEFLQTRVVIRKFSAHEESYKPDDWLRDPGLEYHLEEFTNGLADRITESEKPADALDEVLQDLENYVDLLKRVIDDFHAMKQARLADTDDEVERFIAEAA